MRIDRIFSFSGFLYQVYMGLLAVFCTNVIINAIGRFWSKINFAPLLGHQYFCGDQWFGGRTVFHNGMRSIATQHHRAARF